jgi:hypothetical protein
VGPRGSTSYYQPLSSAGAPTSPEGYNVGPLGGSRKRLQHQAKRAQGTVPKLKVLAKQYPHGPRARARVHAMPPQATA